MFFNTAGQENFAKIYKKTPVYESPFLIKSQASPRNFVRFLSTPFLEHLWTAAFLVSENHDFLINRWEVAAKSIIIFFISPKLIINVSTLSEVSLKKRILENISKFTVKHPCQRLFFLKLQVWPAILLKKKPTQVFSCELCDIFKKIFLYIEDLWWLLLHEDGHPLHFRGSQSPK